MHKTLPSYNMNLDGFDLTDKEISTFHKSYEQLKKKYEIEVYDCDKINDLFSFIDELKVFELLNHYRDFQIINIFNLNSKKENVRIINVYLSYLGVNGKSWSEFSDIQSIGLVELPVDFGHALLTPESTTDKLIDLFLRRDLDFKDNKEFSDKFLLQGTDKEKLRRNFNEIILGKLSKYPNINMEFKKSMLIATFYKTITIKNTLSLADILMKIKKELDTRINTWS